MSGPRVIGRIIAVFIILIFVTVTPALILVHNVVQAAVKGDVLDELFEDPELFETVIEGIAQELPDELQEHRDTRDLPIARLSASEWEQVLEVMAPPETLQAWAQDALDNLRDWVRDGGAFLGDLTLPFGEMRENLFNDPNYTLLRALARSLPECSGSQEPLGGPDDLIPQCRPAEGDLEALYPSLAQGWREHSREIWEQLWPEPMSRYPDDVSLADFTEEETGQEWWEENFGWRTRRWALRSGEGLLTAMIVGPGIVALGLVGLLAARNGSEALRWIGTPLLVAGVFTLLLAGVILIGWDIGASFIPRDAFVGSLEALDTATRAFAGALWPPTAMYGGIMVLIGVGLLILSPALSYRVE